MSTNLETNDDYALLDRAVAVLRDSPVPPGPSASLESATVAALSHVAAPRRSRSAWRLGSVPLLVRAAAIACLAAGAAAAYFAFLHHHQRYVREEPTPTTTDGHGLAGASGGSMITGEIRFEGHAPRLIGFGPAGEGGSPPTDDDSLLVNLDDTLQNVVVWVVAGLPDGKKYPEPADPVYLNQTDRTFQPHVLAMRTGQAIFLRDSDSAPHNTRSRSVRNPRFSVSGADAVSRLPSPREPEIFPVECDVHPWMKAWLCAFDHPYFNVSGPNGTFTLEGLPPGHYRLRAWQERLGTVERDLVVKPGRDETVNFVYRVPAVAKSPQASRNPVLHFAQSLGSNS